MIDSSQNMLLIVEDARSGSTFLTNLLNQHLEIGIAPETECIVQLMKFFGEKQISTDRDLEAALDLIYRKHSGEIFKDLGLSRSEIYNTAFPKLPFLFTELVYIIFSIYQQKNFPESKIWGVKRGRYVFDSLLLAQFFPGAKFINIIRDGRAVFSSKKKAIALHSRQPFETDPIPAAKRWIRAARSFDKLRQRYPDRCLSVTYEGLIMDPENVLESIFRFLNLENQSLSISYGDDTWVPNRYDQIHPNVGKAPQTSRILAWQQELSVQEIQRYEGVAGFELRKRGYKLQHENILLPLTFQYVYNHYLGKLKQVLSVQK